MGRNKIKIEYIKHNQNRRVTFRKRWNGLKRKVKQLSILAGCEVLVIVKPLGAYAHTDVQFLELSSQQPTTNFVQEYLKAKHQHQVRSISFDEIKDEDEVVPKLVSTFSTSLTSHSTLSSSDAELYPLSPLPSFPPLPPSTTTTTTATAISQPSSSSSSLSHPEFLLLDSPISAPTQFQDPALPLSLPFSLPYSMSLPLSLSTPLPSSSSSSSSTFSNEAIPLHPMHTQPMPSNPPFDSLLQTNMSPNFLQMYPMWFPDISS